MVQKEGDPYAEIDKQIAEIDPESLTPEQRALFVEALELREMSRSRNLLRRYSPYPKQLEFHAAGGRSGIRERLLMAGNQLGKTFSAGAETAYHLTGRYPPWWVGKRFPAPTTGWAAGVTGLSTRDNPQRILLGRPGALGTGAIPADAIIEARKSTHGVQDAIDYVVVRHVSGGKSRLYFKSYEQGREKWQGETLDFVWFDEEPPLPIYTEGLTRTNTTKGIAYTTFTPLLGMSDVVNRFLNEKPPGTHVTSMTIDDALHYSPEERAAIIAAYPAHERDARARGIPILGSGRVFPIDEGMLKVKPFQIPMHWPRIAGIDFGWDHPTAVVWLAWDRETDTTYVYDCYAQKEAPPLIHAEAMKARGDWIPVAWPHDGQNKTSAGEGKTLAQQYRAKGVAMLGKPASHPPLPNGKDGGNSVEAGLMSMLQDMQTGRFKVFENLEDWLHEFRMYHREDGKIAKVNDDRLDATRYAYMMRRHAITPMDQLREVAEVVPWEPLDPYTGY